MNEMRKTKLKNLGYSGGGPAKKKKPRMPAIALTKRKSLYNNALVAVNFIYAFRTASETAGCRTNVKTKL